MGNKPLNKLFPLGFAVAQDLNTQSSGDRYLLLNTYQLMIFFSYKFLANWSKTKHIKIRAIPETS